jgi:hypothetical protein
MVIHARVLLFMVLKCVGKISEDVGCGGSANELFAIVSGPYSFLLREAKVLNYISTKGDL